jgi:hypothetical protein
MTNIMNCLGYVTCEHNSVYEWQIEKNVTENGCRLF